MEDFLRLASTALETFWGTVQPKFPVAHPLPSPSSSYFTRNCLPFLIDSSHLLLQSSHGLDSLLSHLPFLQSNATRFQDWTNIAPVLPHPYSPHPFSVSFACLLAFSLSGGMRAAPACVSIATNAYHFKSPCYSKFHRWCSTISPPLPT